VTRGVLESQRRDLENIRKPGSAPKTLDQEKALNSRKPPNKQDVAHILNDETQRKFIQSVKRLMTYCQNKYPPTSFTEALEPGCIDTHAPTILKQVRVLGF
jgi:hypothetical protein